MCIINTLISKYTLYINTLISKYTLYTSYNILLYIKINL